MPVQTPQAKLALLAPRPDDGQRLCFSLSHQYALVPLLLAAVLLMALLSGDKSVRVVGAACAIASGWWAVRRFLWIERLTLDRASGRYEYRQGWWPDPTFARDRLPNSMR